VSADRLLPQAPTWAELATTPTALFLDVDGTLLEFEAHPDLVRATEGLILLLSSISESLDGAVALISGRPLSDLDRIFHPWRPYAAGGHGAEVRGGEGVRLHTPDEALLTSLRREATRRLDSLPGVWVEDKGYGFALHYRALPEHERAVVDLAGRLAEQSEGRLEVQPGMYVQELRPAAYDKGLAVDELMAQRPFTGRRPVVVGDDLTDEFAFAAARRHGGVSVLVGARDDTVATYAIPDPEAVRAWLAEIPEEVAP
jgi:trehalose 6-phosphate phosphatase